jgi:hypothetical protein
MELPPFPDAGEQCVNTTPFVLVASCVNGLRVVQWSYVSEIFNENTAAQRTNGGQCAKVKLLETAATLKWTAEQVAQVAKSLGLK